MHPVISLMACLITCMTDAGLPSVGHLREGRACATRWGSFTRYLGTTYSTVASRGWRLVRQCAT